MLHTGRTAQIRGNLWCDSVVIPSEGLEKGTCRDCTGRSSRQETVQTPNPKGAAKAVAGMHNPLVPGSTPGGPPSMVVFDSTKIFFVRMVAVVATWNPTITAALDLQSVPSIFQFDSQESVFFWRSRSALVLCGLRTYLRFFLCARRPASGDDQ